MPQGIVWVGRSVREGKKFQKGPFLNGVLGIVKGAALAQGLSVLASPLITRIYSPEAMGLLGLFVSFLAIASTFCTFRYDVAVAVVEDDEVIPLIDSCFVIIIFGAVISSWAFEFLRKNDNFGYGSFPIWGTWLIFVASVLSASSGILRYYALRCRDYSKVGRYNICQALIGLIAKILLSFSGFFGLVLGDIVGRFAGFKALWVSVHREKNFYFSRKILFKYKLYPVVHLPSSFINTLALIALVPIFTEVYSLKVGGCLVLAQRVLSLPFGLVSEAVGDVFYGEISRIIKEDSANLTTFLLETVVRLAFFGGGVGVCTWFFAPVVVPYVFGSSWILTGEMMSIMAPWTAIAFTVSSVSRLIFYSELSWIKFYYDLISLIVIGMPLLLKFENPLDALIFVATFQSLLYILYFILIFYISLRRDKIIKS